MRIMAEIPVTTTTTSGFEEETTTGNTTTGCSNDSNNGHADTDTTGVSTTGSSASSSSTLPILPRNNKEYGTKEYWEHRFLTEESFEWLLSYIQVRHQLEPIFQQYCHIEQKEHDDQAVTSAPAHYDFDKSRVRILVVGCGNAPFSCDLYDDGYTNIVNIDYSGTVIQNMQQLHSTSRPNMQWIVMDMTRNTFSNASFDVVIDKAAMDAIMTKERDVWNPNPTVIHQAYQMCYHISRILQPHGTFVQISLTQPHFRNKYLLHLHVNDSIPSSTDEDSDAVITTTVQYSDSLVDPPTSTNNDDANNNHHNNDKYYCPQFDWTVQSEVAGRSHDIGAGAGMFGHYLYTMKKNGT